MRVTDALRTLNNLTAAQWGMVTTAQAVLRGVTRMQLSRLANDGQLERLGHGVYRHTGAPADRFAGLKAAWLSTDPTLTAEERLRAASPNAVVSGATAAHLLGLGDLVPEPYEFTVPDRRQTQRDELVFRTWDLAQPSITIRDGLPVTTQEQTIADLVERRVDITLVAGVLADVRSFNRRHLVDLLAPLARRNGFTANNGEAFCAELERLAGRDVRSLVQALSSAPFAAEFAEQYLKVINPGAMERAAIGVPHAIDPTLANKVLRLVTGVTRPIAQTPVGALNQYASRNEGDES